MVWKETWTVMLTENDILDIELQKRSGRVTAFSVNYRAFAEGRWQSLWRQDTSHGRLHCHRRGRPVRFLEGRAKLDYSADFARAQQEIRATWADIRRRWEHGTD